MSFAQLFLDSEVEEKVDEEETKIINNIVGCNIDQCFKETSKYNPNQKDELIKDINNPQNKEHKRIFYKKGGKVGYIEVFQNPELTFAYDISKKISFLFECMNDEKLLINKEKCFGLRYYNSNNGYCTLLKINDKDPDNYQFLEKIEGNHFYDEKLDCFSIVYESIFSKYKNQEDAFESIMKEGPLYEILGFGHAILSKSNENYKFHKPHTIDILNIKDFTRSIIPGENESILNIQPIIFDGHISILFFVDSNKKRIFFLSDPSHVHSQNVNKVNYNNGFIFPKNMRERMQIFPENKIQKFNSCSFWFYFQMLILINYDKTIQREYITFKDFIISIKDSTFYFECINYYQKLFGFNKALIEINPKIDTLDSDYIYSIPSTQYTSLDNVRINNYGFLNQFVDLTKLFELKTEQDISFDFGFKEMNIFQDYNEDFVDFILELNYNANFLKLNQSKDDNNKIVSKLESCIKNMKNLQSNFFDKCLEYFNYIIKENKYKDMGKNIKKFHLVLTDQNKIINEVKEFYSIYENIKEDIENKTKLYPLSVTSKILYPIVGAIYNSK